MKTRVQNQMLTQVYFDSSAPQGFACLVHRVEDAGEYELELQRSAPYPHEKVALTVAAQPPRGSAADRVDIDLGVLDAHRLKHSTLGGVSTRVMRPGGIVRLASTGKVEAYSARLIRRSDGQCVFDSSRLSSGDVFALTLVRPGEYEVRNELTKHRATIRVEYPSAGKTPYRPPPPLEITCTAKGFSAEKFLMKPAQGLIFRFDVPSRIQVALTAPDDGPGPRADSAERRAPREATLERLRQTVGRYRKLRAERAR
jgi:hypothetical protein